MKFIEYCDRLKLSPHHAREFDSYFDAIEMLPDEGKELLNSMRSALDKEPTCDAKGHAHYFEYKKSAMDILIAFSKMNKINYDLHSGASMGALTRAVISILESGGRDAYISQELRLSSLMSNRA